MAMAMRSLAGASLPRSLCASSTAMQHLEVRAPGAALRRFSAESGLPRLRLRGLPFHATAQDVETIFSGFRLAAGSHSGTAVEFLRGHGRRPTGQAFAYFDDVTEAMRAKDALDGQACYVVGSSVYRLELLEDFKGRAIVTEEDVPGDIEEEKLRDKVRKSMVGKKYQEKLDMKKFKFRQW
eukprot:TRINITY_DN105639_c0_g1_i1.p1 TRINITY_DN105639_c0_g1~~TRINITY_DN105639_c0_g1_i1.p1  ORF type:complete len:188 (-),score=58.00 TRINITY_DN105639_c0_g1_i1:131-673(-)